MKIILFLEVFFFFFLLTEGSNLLGWTNPSEPRGKPGKLPFSYSVVM